MTDKAENERTERAQREQSPARTQIRSWAELRRAARNRVELRILLPLLLVSLGLWAFVEIADEVLEGEIRLVDQLILLMLRNPFDLSDPVGPPWLEEMVRDWSALGGMAVLALVTASATLYLLFTRRYASAALLVIAVGGSALLSVALKAGFDRPRPDLVPHAAEVYRASFPSGHAMVGATTYLTLGVLSARLQRYRRTALLIIALAVLISVLVGVSRVYLGVHYPSDVLAGWIAGAVWAQLCALAAWWLHLRRPGR